MVVWNGKHDDSQMIKIQIHKYDMTSSGSLNTQITLIHLLIITITINLFIIILFIYNLSFIYLSMHRAKCIQTFPMTS